MACIRVERKEPSLFCFEDGRKDIYQWDKNLRLNILGDIPDGSKVHFSSLKDDNENALVVKVYKEDGFSYSDIPNIFLTTTNEFKAYLYIVDGDSEYTKDEITILPKPREKPDDYIYTETEVLNYDNLFKMIDIKLSELMDEVSKKTSASEKVINDKMAELEILENRIREFSDNYINGVLSMVDKSTGETYEVFIENGKLLMNKELQNETV